MEFYAAVFISIFWLLVASALGGLIIYLILNRKNKILIRENKEFIREIDALKEEGVKKQKYLQLEVDARDKKMQYLRADLEQALQNARKDSDFDDYILKQESEQMQTRYKEHITILENKLKELQLKQGTEYILKKECDEVQSQLKEKITVLETQIRDFEVKKETEVKPEKIHAGLPILGDKREGALLKIREKSKTFDFSNIGIATEEEKEDLQIIVGIGPFIEEKLNALGIFTFLQISKFQETDIQNVTEVIEFFPGRIVRDNWIGQAKELLKQKP